MREKLAANLPLKFKPESSCRGLLPPSVLWELCSTVHQNSLWFCHPCVQLGGGRSWSNVVCEVQVSWGPDFLCLSALYQGYRGSDVLLILPGVIHWRYQGLHFKMKSKAAMICQPHSVWAWALARADQRLSSCHSIGPVRPLGVG